MRRMRNRLLGLAISTLLLSCLMPVSQIQAQRLEHRSIYPINLETGSIYGTVTESNGTTSIPGVVVTAFWGSSLKESATTGMNGIYIITNLSPGTYTLKASKDGYATQLRTGIGIEIGTVTLPVNFPLIKLPDGVTGWTRAIVPGTYGVVSAPALVDIDKDGELEIIICSAYPDNRVYVLNPDGSDVAGWPKELVGGMHSSPAIGDVDDDGELEIVVGLYWEGRIYALNANGSKYWETNIEPIIHATPAIGDIYGDKGVEVVVGSEDGKKVYALSGKNGDILPNWPISVGAKVNSSPALGDIDGDGNMEVVVGGDDCKVYAWDGNGITVTGWPKQTSNGVRGSPVLGDIDGDGDLEIIAGTDDGYVHAWHGNGDRVAGWPVSVSGEEGEFSPALTDIDGDGRLEVVVSFLTYNKGTVSILNADGNIRWQKVIASQGVSPPALGDINNDGKIEIIIGSNDGRVYAVKEDGDILDGWPIDTGQLIHSSPAIEDIDKDGAIEIVIGSGGLLKEDTPAAIHCWKMKPNTYNPDLLPWPMFRHDMSRMGLYGHSISGKVINEMDKNPIPNATVEAWQNGRMKKETSTDANGRYVITNLPVVPSGSYEVKVSTSGYYPANPKKVDITNGIKKDVDFSLSQSDKLIIFNYPNPVRDNKTIFRYYLNKDAEVAIDIYDISYEWVETLTACGKFGENEIVWDVKDIARGVYLYIFKVNGEKKAVKKVMVIK